MPVLAVKLTSKAVSLISLNEWLYGVVEPLSGWHFCQEYAHLNTEYFQQFIDTLGEQLGEDIAQIQMDQAGAHVTNELRWPENLIPVCQPGHSPQSSPDRGFCPASFARTQPN